MRRLKKMVTTLALVFVILCFIQPAAAETTVHIGVLAKRGAQKAIEKWQPTAEYLSKRLRREVVVVPLKFVEIEPALKNNRIDFLLANSAFYARFEKKYNLKALMTMVNNKNDTAMYQFGGVIFTRKNSRIKKLQDIKGKKFMCVKYSSFGGAQMAWRLLVENNIDPKKDCAAFIQGGTHDKVVMAVKNGAVDVGTVRSDTLERMEAEGKINMSDFRVVNPIRDSFPFVHSTTLYPEWPFVACAKAGPELRKKAATALYLLENDHPAIKAAKIYSWRRPANYSDVTACLKVIGAM